VNVLIDGKELAMKTATLPTDEILKTMAAEAVKQQHHLRETVCDLTLKALQARELNLKQINGVVGSIAQGINTGAASNKKDMKNVLSDAFSGMDDALLKVVEANKIALQKLTEGGASFEDSSVKKALTDLEKIEDQFLSAIQKASNDASEKVKQNWKTILDKMPHGTTVTGAKIDETLSAQSRQMRETVRASRETSLKTVHALTQNYATLVSGVLMGLSEAFGKKSAVDESS
jgi:uncharacterized protein DUF6781